MRSGDLIEDRYLIDRVAGRGGMGMVHRAVDQVDGGLVAIKSIPDGTPEDLARFAHEARILAELSHSHIVRYIGQGIAEGGEPYLIMEWLEGESLDQRLTRGALGMEDAVSLARCVASALAAAHARGVVHRDVKPSNIFVVGGRIDDIRLLDFGIARLSNTLTALTMLGSTVGTPGYMAPEQASGRGDDIDGRADIFSLGCVLFECLAGRPPFAGRHVMAILAKLLMEEAPQLHELVSTVPPALDTLVARMLSKDPAGRPASAPHVVAALDACGWDGPATMPAGAGSITRAEKRLIAVVAVLPDAAPRAAVQAITVVAGPTPQGFLGLARQAAVPFGAKVAELASGGLVALLDRAGPATDQAAAAARCALQMRARLPTAPMVLLVGHCEGVERSPVGEVLEKAAEMLGRAAVAPVVGGESARIEIDSLALALLGERFHVEEEAGRIYLCGEHGPSDQTPQLLGKRSPFVGRERELRHLGELVDEGFEERRAAAILITAAAGMGKSRLRQALCAALRARRSDLVLLFGCADSLVARSPFSIAGSAFQHGLGVTAGDPLPLRRARLDAFVRRYVVAEERRRVAALLGEVIGTPSTDELSPALYAARQSPGKLIEQIGAACADVLRAVTREQPVLMILEDLHWGDPQSVALVDGLLRDLADEPFVVVAFGRPEMHDAFPGLWAGRNLQEIRLRELPRRAAESVVRAALGDAPSSASVTAIVDRAAGNVFYLEELIRAVVEGRGERLPATVLGMVEARLAGLDAESRRLLRAASIFGEVFWKDGVLTLLGEASSAHPGADGGDRFTRLCDQELIVRLPGGRFAGEDEYAFRHALLREGAYATLTDRDRAFGHWLVGNWLEDVGEPDLLVLAEHFLRGGEPQRAIAHYLGAGNTARAAAAGCEALRASGVELPVGEDERRVALDAVMSTDAAEARARPPAARLSALEMTDPAALATERLLLAVTLPAYFQSVAFFGLVVRSWLDLVGRHGHSDLSAMGYAMYGAFLSGIEGRGDDAYAFGKLSIALLEQRPNRAVYCRVIETFSGNVAFQHEPLRDVLSRFPLALRVGIEEGDLLHAAYVCGHVGAMRLAAGDDLAELAAQIEEQISIVDSARDVFMQACVRINGRTVRALRGATAEPPEAPGDLWSEEAILRLEESDDLRTLAGYHHTQRLLLHVVQGAWPEALVEAEAAEAKGPYAPGQFFVTELSFLAALARLRAAPPALDPALSAHRDHLRALSSSSRATYLAKHLLVEAEIARVGGAPEVAADHYEKAIAAAHEHGMTRDLALANELAATFHASLGRTAVAAGHREAARAAYRRWGAMAKVQAMDRPPQEPSAEE